MRQFTISALAFCFIICSLYLLGGLPFQDSIKNDLILLRGSEETTAIIIGESSTARGAVVYEYSVNGESYKGQSSISYEPGESYDSKRKVGTKIVVYYSLLKPELSLLREPEIPLSSLIMLGLFGVVFYGHLAFEVIPKILPSTIKREDGLMNVE